MGMHYGQLDLDERIELSRLHEAGIAPSEIARIMGRHPTTIGRELRRNSLRWSHFAGQLGGVAKVYPCW